MQQTIKVHNKLLDLSIPRVMAIVNITPNSFYTSWGYMSEENLLCRVAELVEQGADIIDLGACSTQPGSTPVSEEEEWHRLAPALQAIRKKWPEIVLSVDTFRAEIAEKAIINGADIINDVYGGENDNHIWNVVAKYRVPYILTHAQEIDKNSHTEYDDTMSQVLDFFQSRLDILHKMGIADVIVDPGFGFAKNEQQNYAILRQMDILKQLNTPILAGISRKSMLYKPLGLKPELVLPATITANTIALEKGAHILRVHDVAETKQTIQIYSLAHKQIKNVVRN